MSELNVPTNVGSGDLGMFSLSLAVKDIAASRRFYEALGFEKICGADEEKWMMLANGESKIGLFEGMFDANIITFNPTNVRKIQARARDADLEFLKEADSEGTGPHSCMLRDPDGNTLLFDQHGESGE